MTRKGIKNIIKLPERDLFEISKNYLQIKMIQLTNLSINFREKRFVLYIIST